MRRVQSCCSNLFCLHCFQIEGVLESALHTHLGRTSVFRGHSYLDTFSHPEREKEDQNFVPQTFSLTFNWGREGFVKTREESTQAREGKSQHSALARGSNSSSSGENQEGSEQSREVGASSSS